MTTPKLKTAATRFQPSYPRLTPIIPISIDPEEIEGFACKINAQAHGAALRHSLGGSDGRAQTQDVS